METRSDSFGMKDDSLYVLNDSKFVPFIDGHELLNELQDKCLKVIQGDQSIVRYRWIPIDIRIDLTGLFSLG